MLGHSSLTTLVILWGVVTVPLAILLIYRSLIAMKEDDQIFLSAGEANLEREQQRVQKRLQTAGRYTKILGTASGLLLGTITVLWAYGEYTTRFQ